MSYAVNSGTFWVKTETKVEAPIKKSKKTIEIINPIFSECAKLCDDEFWKDIFNNMSVGKFPKKFNYKNGTIIYRIKSRAKILDIGTNPTQVKEQVITFITGNSGMMSEIDRREQNERIIESLIFAEKALDENEIFNNKKLFNSLICEFVFKRPIPNKERHELYAEITLANTLGLIHQDDIEYGRDNEDKIIITNIKSIEKDENGKYTTIRKAPVIPFSNHKYIVTEKPNPISKSWSNYIKWINKKELVGGNDQASMISG